MASVVLMPALMRLVDVTLKILGLSEAMRRWQGMIRGVDVERRAQIGRYAEQIATSLGRAAFAYEALARNPADRGARTSAIRELGRLAGYIETICTTLEGRFDGRRLAGLKRRLEGLAAIEALEASLAAADSERVERLVAAEGYFHALADALRT